MKRIFSCSFNQSNHCFLQLLCAVVKSPWLLVRWAVAQSHHRANFGLCGLLDDAMCAYGPKLPNLLVMLGIFSFNYQLSLTCISEWGDQVSETAKSPTQTWNRPEKAKFSPVCQTQRSKEGWTYWGSWWEPRSCKLQERPQVQVQDENCGGLRPSLHPWPLEAIRSFYIHDLSYPRTCHCASYSIRW